MMSTSNLASFAELGAAIRQRQRFVIVSHLRPDGDALGSQIALGLSLRAAGKDVTLWNEDGMLDKLRFLPGSELVWAPPAAPRDFDALIALDTAAESRLGTAARAIGKAGLTLNIDHHISNNGYGDLARIDSTAPATGQIVYEWLADQGFPLDANIATNLFAAISTDTGSFQYPQTSARTYEIGAALIRLGVKVGELSQQLYESHPYRRVELLRELLNALKMSPSRKVASFALTREAAGRLGVSPEDNEGLIDHLRGIDTVLAAAFFEELADGSVRVSLRSKTTAVDVSAICGSFGGGGHQLAAGARIRGDLAEVETRVLARINEVLSNLQNP